MDQKSYLAQIEQQDLSICMYGMEQCQPDHAYGPAVRDYFLIHYVHSGKGIFSFNDQTWRLKCGQGFLICPDQVTYYQADSNDPWHYYWIGFKGKLADAYVRRGGLSQASPIFGQADSGRDPFLESLFLAMNSDKSNGPESEIRLLGLLHLFLAHLIAVSPDKQEDSDQLSRRHWYVRQAINIIQANDHRRVSISELAGHIGLDRSYFGAIFRQVTGKTPQQFSLEQRMEKAKRLLGRQSLTVAAVARSIGYDDPLLFSRMFHRITGFSPTGYRKVKLN